MKVKFLGTSGYMPTDYRHTNCIMLPEEGIVLDAGTGFYRTKDNVKTKKLDILLSHYHPDHIHGLTFMLGNFYNSDLRISIYGPGGIRNLERNLGFPIKFKDHPFEIKIKKIKKKFTLDDVVVETKPFPHLDQVSIGYKLEKEGKILCYVTDLTASDDEVSFVKDADLLIHECYFEESRKELAKDSYHSYTTQVAEIARKANVKRLALHHLNPFFDENRLIVYVKECKKIFKNTFLPYDNMEVAI